MKRHTNKLHAGNMLVLGAVLVVGVSIGTPGPSSPGEAIIPSPSSPEDIRPVPQPETPVEPETPEDPEGICESDIVRFDVIRDQEGNARGGTLTAGQMFDASQVPPGFSCINNIVQNAFRCADRRVGNYRRDRYWDDAVAYCFSKEVFGDQSWDSRQGGNASYALTASQRAAVVNSRDAYCQKKSYIHVGNGRMQCVTGHVYYNESCQRVDMGLDGLPVDPNLQICANPQLHFVKSTPLSLVWEDNADHRPSTAVVSFPVNPEIPNAQYSWKASASLPLVVYDPEHRGEITTAFQLFGNWTFGGKKLASLGSSRNELSPTPWENGYEALATLDADGNGKIDGAELAPLGLWFDFNQNGISEPGEVRPLQSAGVTALFYQPDSFDAESQTIRAAQGFERMVDGQTVAGPSIDWFAARSTSAHQLIDKLLEQGKPDSDFGRPSEAISSTEAEADAKNDEIKQPASGELNPELTGVWEWRLEGASEQATPIGYLMLQVDKDGSVRGTSVAPTYFSKLPGMSTRLDLFEVGGSVQQSAQGDELALEIRNERSVVRTQARRDGELLRGESSAYISEAGRREKITYRWYAVRKRS